MKKIVSFTLLLSLSLTSVVNAFTPMDICNKTNGDTSGNYHDGKCDKKGTPSEKKNEISTSIKNKVPKGNDSTVFSTKDKFTHKLKETDIKIHHSFPILMSEKERNATKDRQLCKTATSFDILNEDGTVKYTYYPQGCQSTEEEFSEEKINTENTVDETNKADNDTKEVDNFIDSLFGDEVEKQREIKKEEIIDSKTKIEEIKDNATSTGDTLDSDTDFNNIFKEIFETGYKVNTSLKGSKFAKALKNYSEEKITIKVGAVKANVLGNNMDYNSKVAILLNKIDKKLKIDSIKNSLAKNISNVSFSLSTYQNTTDTETKEVFKNKLINDLKTLKKKYKILKNKDAMISKTLEKRGLL